MSGHVVVALSLFVKHFTDGIFVLLFAVLVGGGVDQTVLDRPFVRTFGGGVLGVEDAVETSALVERLVMVAVHGLHLDDEVSRAGVDVGGVENRGVCLESARGLVPPATVKGVEVVAPVELKLVLVLVVREHLHVVVEHIPGHV